MVLRNNGILPHHSTEDHELNLHCHENLKSHIAASCSTSSKQENYSNTIILIQLQINICHKNQVQGNYSIMKVNTIK
jgi:hypothetical protein